MIDNQDYWGGTDMVYQCLVDEQRVTAFKKAITNSIIKDDIVVDLGSGSGIMAFFAIEAGAKRVYVFESNKTIRETLQKNLNNTKFKDKIIILGNDAISAVIHEKIDFVICEMIATALIDELQIPAMNNILQFCKPTSRILISKIRNFAEMVFVDNNFYGHKIQVVQYEYPWEAKRKAQSISNAYMYSEINFNKINDGVVNTQIPFIVQFNSTLNGIRLTNETIFSDGSRMNGSAAYCMPLILPLDEIKVQKGQKFILDLEYQMCSGMNHLKMRLNSVDNKENIYQKNNYKELFEIRI